MKTHTSTASPNARRIVSAALHTALLAAPAFAQGVGSAPAPGTAGTVNDSRATVPVPALPGAVSPARAPAAAAAAAAVGNGGRTVVNDIVFEGNTLFTRQELLDATLTAAVKGQPLNMAQLQAVVDTVTAIYRSKGFAVATAILPKQEVVNGIVRVRVFEGRFEQASVNPGASSDLVQKLVVQTADAAIAFGRRDALRQSDLERATMLAGEVTGSSVSGSLVPGATEGSTALIFDVKPLERFSGNVKINNAGVESTGVVQMQAQLVGRSLIVPGDVVDANLLTTNKTSSLLSYGAGYDMPLGVQGLRAGVRASSTQYNLGGVFAGQGFKGTAQSMGGNVGYALQRSFNATTDVRVGYNLVSLKDSNSVTTSNERKTNILWADLRGNFNDSALTSPAYNQWGLSASFGNLKYNSVALQAADAAGLDTAGSYQIITADYLRDQIISGSWSARLALRAQMSSKNLDSYHKFRLGGANGVRAFAEGEAAGDTGQLMRIELAHTSPVSIGGISATSRISAFYDQGQVKFNDTPLVANAASNTGKLAGYGLQWQWTQSGMRPTDQLDLRAFWAKPTGTPTVSSVDNKASRMGLELGYRF